jgi:hypothetical protein
MKLKLFVPFTIATLIILTQSCTPEYGAFGSSASGSNRSHNVGQNCMNCHRPGGGEAGTWNVAGTVYNDLGIANPNATVKLYTGPDGTGTLKYTINVDALGNFYTSSSVDFTGGLYPAVVGATTTNLMANPITNGACNSCHDNVTRSRIWVN